MLCPFRRMTALACVLSLLFAAMLVAVSAPEAMAAELEPEQEIAAEPPETTEASQSAEPEEPEEAEEPEAAETEKDVDIPIPLYDQTAYTDVYYGTGTVATSGCSMTSLAMVATYLTGNEILPDELARRFAFSDYSLQQRMEAAAIVLDLDYSKAKNFDDVIAALKNGEPVIVMENCTSWFSTAQHYIVLRGITADGRILVNDPLGTNYYRAELLDGFQNGFPQHMIMQGYSGGWIFHGYTPPQTGASRYEGVELTNAEKYLLARLIWLEGRGEPFAGQQAIAEVVLNRLVSPTFRQYTINDVIYAKDQFRSTEFLEDASADELQYKAIERALNGPNILPMDVYFYGTYYTNDNFWGKIGNHIFCGPFD